MSTDAVIPLCRRMIEDMTTRRFGERTKRSSEIVHLKVADVDSTRTLIRVEQGKGREDRTVMRSPELLDLLRQWWLGSDRDVGCFPVSSRSSRSPCVSSTAPVGPPLRPLGSTGACRCTRSGRAIHGNSSDPVA